MAASADPSGAGDVLVLGAGFSRAVCGGMPLVDELGKPAAEREARARAVLAENFRVEVTDTELAASVRLREMIARRDSAA